MLKKIFNKLLQTDHKLDVKSISQEEVEALVEARLREHAASIEQTVSEKVSSVVQSANQEDYSLSPKQIDFALDLIEKTREYELAIDKSNLTLKDLNKLIAFNKFKNKGILVNLVKKGILRKK